MKVIYKKSGDTEYGTRPDWLTNEFIQNLPILWANGSGGGYSDDKTPPTIISISPDNCVGINEPIFVIFSEDIDPVTINSASFFVSGDVTGIVNYDTTAKKAFFTPAENLAPNTQYNVTITSDIKDLAGNAMPGYNHWSFTTGFAEAAGTWQEISSGSPMLARLERAVWSGSEILIFGGFTHANRFNPFNNTWKNLSWVNMPSGREYHTAVWAGTEMIVWGGTDQILYLNNGGRYNPSTDTWIATSTIDIPLTEAQFPIAYVWTGTELIVWDGYNAQGGRYNP